MPGNTFGHSFRVTTFGESHGPAIGAIIDGCPAGLEIDIEFIKLQLARRKPGQSKIVTQRNEDEAFEILSGVFENKSTGTPISILIRNKDARSKDYKHIAEQYRPSHADFTYAQKYMHRDYRGGGRSSARETASRVAAGAIAQMLLKQQGIRIQAFVNKVGKIALDKEYANYNLDESENNIVRCPDHSVAESMIELIQKIKKEGDTIGGEITCVIKGLSAGLGEPVFDKLHADLAKAIIGINACKGFEYGSGFSCVEMKGSEHNDVFYKDEGHNIKTRTNHSGGIQGGISNGMDVYFKAAFKPVATIIQTQKSVDKKGVEVEISGKGRHDPCVVPRAVPIVEAMAALVLVDHLLRNRTSRI